MRHEGCPIPDTSARGGEADRGEAGKRWGNQESPRWLISLVVVLSTIVGFTAMILLTCRRRRDPVAQLRRRVGAASGGVVAE
jgi:hypothetical protein